MVPHYFNKTENLDYFALIPDLEYYGVKEMGVSEQTEFLAWYEEQKSVVFNNSRYWSRIAITMLVLRQGCRLF
jgi:hypothetical protein